jgi:hypothetical protein
MAPSSGGRWCCRAEELRATEAGLARGSMSAIGLGTVFVGAGQATQSETWRCSVIEQVLSTVVCYLVLISCVGCLFFLAFLSMSVGCAFGRRRCSDKSSQIKSLALSTVRLSNCA